MSKHYPKKLLDDYELLLPHFPSNTICRPFIVERVNSWENSYQQAAPLKLLEAGPGYGETTRLFLERPELKLTLVDNDEASIVELTSLLRSNIGKHEIIQANVTEWIRNQQSSSFDIFSASWVIHNFPHEERLTFLREIFRVLRTGGLMVLFDKILPDDTTQLDTFWETHLERLGRLIKANRKDLYDSMIEHEKRDAQPPFVWYEADLKRDLAEIGFVDFKIHKRCERDIVFSSIR